MKETNGGWEKEQDKFMIFFRDKDGKLLGTREASHVHIRLSQLKDEIEDIIIIPLDDVKDFENGGISNASNSARSTSS